MKKTLIALASVAALGAAHADVTLYGILDANVTTMNHSVAADPNAAFNANPLIGNSNAIASNRVTLMGNGGLGLSRWGIKGKDQESGAIFTLESNLNVPFGANPNGRISNAASAAATPGGGTSIYASEEGSANGVMFARESTVGLEGAMGRLTLGRQTTIAADALGNYDALGASPFSPLVYNGGYGGSGFTAESRWDQSVKYKTQLQPNLRLDLGYKLGGSATNFSQGSAFAVGLNYTVQPGLEIFASYTANKDAQLAGAGTAAANVLTESITFADTHANMFAVSWVVSPTLTFKGGLENIVTGVPSNPAYDGQINVISNVFVNLNDTTGFQVPRQQNIYWGGVNYVFAPKWTANLGLYQLNTSSYGTTTAQGACPGTYSTACTSSRAQYEALTITNDINKALTLYVGLASDTVSGPAYGTTAANAKLPITAEMAGLRVKF